MIPLDQHVALFDAHSVGSLQVLSKVLRKWPCPCRREAARECIRRDLFPPFSEQKPSKVIASIKSKYLKCLPRFITLSHPDLLPAQQHFCAPNIYS